MCSLRLRSLAIAAATALLAVPAALAQSPTALVQEGLALTGGPVEHLVVSINNPAVNHSGGYAFNVNTSDGTTTLSRFWGAGVVLRTEGTFGIYEQTAWESFYGLGGGNALAYSPTCNNSQSGSTGLDGVWLDDDPVAVEEEVYPWAAGFWWSFGSRPGVTESGVPYWVGGITDTQGGSTDNRGLFYGLDAQPLLLGGQVLPGVPAPLATVNTPSFDYRFSAFGGHYLAEVETAEASDANNYLVVDGAALLADGTLVAEGRPVPAAAGGLVGENWDNFDFVGITENGRYMFTGDTDAAASQDEIVVVDGVIIHREGDVVDGQQLTGAISGAYMNEDGDYALEWEIVTPGGPVDALIFNGAVVAVAGDPIDLDGDSIPEAGTTLLAFTGISALVLSDRDGDGICRLYFTADVDVVPVQAPATPIPALAGGTAEELGYDGEIPALDDRLAVEMGLVLPTAQVVPTYITAFTASPRDGAVVVTWQTRLAGRDDRFRLTAREGARVRDVAFAADGPDRFTALDAPASGEVIYTLMLARDGGVELVLGERTVTVAPHAGLTLAGASPNPFNPLTRVTFTVDRPQAIRLSVFDTSGRRIAVLADQVFPAGTHGATWDGTDASGARMPSGSYVARLEGEDGNRTLKLMLVK